MSKRRKTSMTETAGKKRMVAEVEHSKCDNSPFCMPMRACRKNIIKRDGPFLAGHKPKVEKEDCEGCGLCVRYCPHGAVKMVTHI